MAENQKRSHVEPERPLSKKEAAELLGVSVDTLSNWTERFGIPYIKYALPDNRGNKGRVIYLVKDIMAFRDSFRVNKQPGEDSAERNKLNVAGAK